MGLPGLILHLPLSKVNGKKTQNEDEYVIQYLAGLGSWAQYAYQFIWKYTSVGIFCG